MSQDEAPNQLSPEALAEYAQIYREEFGEPREGEDLEKQAQGFLSLTWLLVRKDDKPSDEIPVTEREFLALKFLHHSIHHEKRSPSVRDVAAAIGLRLSRSGFRLVEGLMKRGLVFRSGDGTLGLTDQVKVCDAKFKKSAVWYAAEEPRYGML